MSNIILINESRRMYHFPAVVIPEDRAKLNDDGKARDAKNLPVDVRRKRFGPLDVGARIEVPEWYFRELIKLRQLKALFEMKTGGISVGQSAVERASATVHAREIALAAEAREAKTQADQLATEAASAKAQTAQLETELEKMRADMAAMRSEFQATLEKARVEIKKAREGAKAEPKPDSKVEDKG